MTEHGKRDTSEKIVQGLQLGLEDWRKRSLLAASAGKLEGATALECENP